MFIISFLTNKEQNFKDLLLEDIKRYQDLFKRILSFSNGKVSKEFLNSNVLYTSYTRDLELDTIKYFDIGLDPSITLDCLKLIPGNMELLDLKEIDKYMEELLELLNKSTNILNNINIYITKNNMFLTIYPLVIDHMINENKLLKDTLERLLKRVGTDPTYVYILEYYYSLFLKEHSLLIRNLMNPLKDKEVEVCNKYYDLYNSLLTSFNNEVSPYSIDGIYNRCINITNNFKSFLEDAINITIKNPSNFMVVPIVLDHLLREANSYINNLNHFNR